MNPVPPRNVPQTVLQTAAAEEAVASRRALGDRSTARRRAKEAELERRGGGESEYGEVDQDLARLEELESEVRILLLTSEGAS